MSMIWSGGQLWSPASYGRESELEDAILELQAWIFGRNRIYLDVKRLIGRRNDRRNIPDGWLIDLEMSPPRLVVVENELARHDELGHIAVQILQFSLSFEADRRRVREVILEAIQENEGAKGKCLRYTREHGLRNLDHFIDELVFHSPFAALVVIDELSPRLEKVLAEKFRFDVQVLTLERFANEAGDYSYRFEALDEAEPGEWQPADEDRARTAISSGDIDTVVTPEDKFPLWQEERWCWCRHIPQWRRERIRYIAAYRLAPISAITHIAEVASMKSLDDLPGWMHVHFSGPPQELPVPLRRARGSAVQVRTRRYANRSRLLAAKTLDEVFYLERGAPDAQ